MREKLREKNSERKKVREREREKVKAQERESERGIKRERRRESEKRELLFLLFRISLRPAVGQN